MSAPKSSSFVTLAVMTLLLSLGVHSVGLAGPWMYLFPDTGLSDDTGTVSDDSGASTDTAEEPEASTDTGEDSAAPTDPTDDTSVPPDTGDDTGTGSQTGGDTGDTGEGPEEGVGHDTGPAGKSAAELAGEKGGCGCAAGASPATGFVWLGAMLMAVRRRR